MSAPLTQTLEDPADRALIRAVEAGLPLVPRPYQAVGETIGMEEAEVIRRLRGLLERGIIKRLGVVVRHRELGYRANAMVVWDIPDSEVSALGRCIGRFDFVTLCYRRPPAWPYNLFTMIHGKDRAEVLAKIDQVVERCGLERVRHEVLFSGRRFKQRGARYAASRMVPKGRGVTMASPRAD